MTGRRPLPPRPHLFAGASVLVAIIVILIAAPPVQAHSFLVSTTPAQGERLSQAPEWLLLEFSEEVDLASTELRLLSSDAAQIAELKPEAVGSGLGIRASLKPLENGVYVVSWQAQSAIDGHGSLGEYAFSVGPVSTSGVLSRSRQSEPVDAASVISSWLFEFGLAAALGGLTLTAIGITQFASTSAAVRAGLLLSLFGVGAAALSDGSRPAMLLVVAQLLLVPIVLTGAERSWKLATGSAVAAAGIWATRSHGAASGPVGWATDYVHLVAGAAWAGSLGLLLVIGWQNRRKGLDWLPLVQRYAQLAVWFVLALGVTGTVAALDLVPGWEQLRSTSYGRILLVKVALFAAALVAALAARRRVLRRSSPIAVRRIMAAESACIAVAIALAGLLGASTPPPRVATADQLLGPVPLGAQVTRDAGLAGQLNVEVSSNADRLDIRVFGPSGSLPGTEIQAVITDPNGRLLKLEPRPCGSGCFTQAVNLKPGATRVAVTARAPGWTGGEITATLHWPPGGRRPDLLQDAVAKMRSIPTLTLTETVDSGPGSTVRPNTFTLSGDQFIDAEPYAGANLEEVWLLPGEPVRLQIYLPGSQIFGLLELDQQGRISRSRLITPGHLITREFAYPD